MDVDADDSGCDDALDDYEGGVAGDLVVTEFLADAGAVDDADGEFFEVYNPTTIAIDLDGWVISDAGGETHTIVGSLPVLPTTYVVLARDATFADNGGVVVDYAYGSDMQLANGDDEIILTDPGGAEIVNLAYTAAWPVAAGATTSLNGALIPDAIDAADPANWCSASLAWATSAGDLGSPGLPNEVCIF